MKIAEFSPDPLFELERKIAQRADELARNSDCDRDHALECWLRAEREIWSSLESLPTPVAIGTQAGSR